MIVYGEAPVRKRVVLGGTCSCCERDFNFVFPSENYSEAAQFEGCTHLSIHAGYGESPFLDGTANAEICDECMEKILEAFPFLRKVISESEFRI